MTEEEKKKAAAAAKKAYLEKRKEELYRLDHLGAEHAQEIRRILSDSQADLKKILGAQPTDYQKWRLTEIDTQIAKAMERTEKRLRDLGGSAMEAGWEAGENLITAPLAAGQAAAAALGVEAPLAKMTHVSMRQLTSMKNFTINKMGDVTAEIRRKISSELGAVITGVRPINQAVKEIAGHVEGGRARALRIVHTNLGTCYNSATQARMIESARKNPNLKKMWRRSGKRLSRPMHDLADGQTVAVDEPFMVGGEAMMYPCDPNASAKNIMNCGCRMKMWVEKWDMLIPGQKEFSDDELAGDANKRMVQEIRDKQ